ncbi:RtcB family protein [Paracoccus sp. (in: a-proteobacteria)]|uniref:RtcB family protein n=1 Tax=Paracoccus sp. TaxID=267 RepID=UPI0026DF7367|nr:RtcB family protein [Paracoccus sp. (in: a-proteobacteria)]MDO5648204.1 RtcB family protein [Paracoccus sp. (in: a-proteobacteria)]
MDTTTPITGQHLKEWGHNPGPLFPALLSRANDLRAAGADDAHIRAELDAMTPPPPAYLPLRAPGSVAFHENIAATNDDEAANLRAVRASMVELMRTPTVVAGAIMPDACPSGPVGTIPVGGVVATRNAIHPGMHSADICCSLMMSDLGDADPGAVLDGAQSVTHFGQGGRPRDGRFVTDAALLDAFSANPFLNDQKLLHLAKTHMGTQGDGNHFLFVGRSRKTGRTMLVTHHGSRGPGALLFKAGMAAAETFRRQLSPDTLKQNAWLPGDSAEGRDYWAALHLMRAWTHANHQAIHLATAQAAGAAIADQIWNEHNFVFERNGLFLHGKGATPAWADYAHDATGLTLIPLNMAEPVLVTRGRDAAHGLGFSPHGAGRNFSRTEHKRRNDALTPQAMMQAETAGLDVRFFAGTVDASELPSAYKSAETVVGQIRGYDLAEIEDYIDPHGCIMAGDLPPFWLNRKKRR